MMVTLLVSLAAILLIIYLGIQFLFHVHSGTELKVIDGGKMIELAQEQHTQDEIESSIKVLQKPSDPHMKDLEAFFNRKSPE